MSKNNQVEKKPTIEPAPVSEPVVQDNKVVQIGQQEEDAKQEFDSGWLIDDSPGKGLRAVEKLSLRVIRDKTMGKDNRLAVAAADLIEFGFHQEILPFLTKFEDIKPETFGTLVAFCTKDKCLPKLIDLVNNPKPAPVKREGGYCLYVLVTRFNSSVNPNVTNSNHKIRVVKGSHRGKNLGVVEIELNRHAAYIMHPDLIVEELIEETKNPPVEHQLP